MASVNERLDRLEERMDHAETATNVVLQAIAETRTEVKTLIDAHSKKVQEQFDTLFRALGITP